MRVLKKYQARHSRPPADKEAVEVVLKTLETHGYVERRPHFYDPDTAEELVPELEGGKWWHPEGLGELAPFALLWRWAGTEKLHEIIEEAES